MEHFRRMERLPPYLFKVVDQLKMDLRRKGEDIIDLGMGNPDMATPRHIVDKLVEAAQKPHNHRYSASAGIKKLRYAIADWYARRWDVEIDPDEEAIATIGAKEGLAHLVLATVSPGDVVFAPNPTYPIHPYSVIIAGGDLRSIPIGPERDFFEDLLTATKQTWPRPKMLIISFPHNPTTTVVDRPFLEKIVSFCRDHDILVLHDFAYADIVFDGYVPPSFLQVPGAKDIGVEFFSLSKSYSMPGWRVGFCVGNRNLISALRRIKSYLDYGMFQPIQIASIIALNGPYECVQQIVRTYKERRDMLVSGLNRIGWSVEKPKGTMFVWARIPEKFRQMGSIEFSKMLIQKAKVAVSPGIGFGHYGDDHVRFALVENSHRIKQAIRGIRQVL
ncbi:MAG: aminotransferase class I/II-fold pyridoxal phosphate-dependent enzyme [Deltaproteobacteria bacterium]|nr:aminotransferase class I/II-fold pyridoxal phosphate-dependent enzyme [Deltaproteobacteria bacterium]MBW1976501.1 aminotransferase class I/II-fold pyridoxal phosphate-dependent enzyme [Deltaproteobacteria bacterium]MBW2044292.1 aminotransferase class I/II-fold pyridoxal phosphate-dependent enzyme [Deltaproteobacteria bacterium]MBW2298679.1 aminotransferase class I/II-fold pyridoxal phosphate-dependent enzyme [Deltaproteobacteria bacterium]